MAGLTFTAVWRVSSSYSMRTQSWTRSLAVVQVAALSWPEFCRLWKDYIEAMSSALVDASTAPADSAAAQWLARLVYETGKLVKGIGEEW